MPTQAKVDKVSELQEKLERCSIAVTTSFSNIPVNEMTELRRRTRAAGVEFLVIKNTIMSLGWQGQFRHRSLDGEPGGVHGFGDAG